MGNNTKRRQKARSTSSAGSTPRSSKRNSTDLTTNARLTKKANVVSPGIDLEQTSSLTVTQVRSNPMTFKILLLLINGFNCQTGTIK